MELKLGNEDIFLIKKKKKSSAFDPHEVENVLFSWFESLKYFRKKLINPRKFL